MFLQIHDVVCSYGSTPVLGGVSFAVARGDVVGIIGPNGSGKSSLLKAISRVLPPSRGQVVLDGADIYKIKPARLARSMAVVAQETHQGFEFSVEELVLMGRIPHMGRFSRPSGRDLEAAREAMRLVHVEDLAERPVGKLSGGERQRVMIARALAQQPEILLLDEPTSHLDITHQVGILELLKELNEARRLTIIMAVHDLSLAARYCRQLILLRDGEIFAIGSPDEVINESNLTAVYGDGVTVVRHPGEGLPLVVPVPTRRSRSRPLNLHVVGGGGVAASLIDRLSLLGHRLCCGVLNVRDTDWERAVARGARVVEAPPFSAVGEEERRRNLDLMKAADVVLLAAVPFGHGNLTNLISVLEVAKSGKPVIVVDDPGIQERDYTGGLATRFYMELLESGVLQACSEQEAARMVEDMASPDEEGERNRGTA